MNTTISSTAANEWRLHWPMIVASTVGVTLSSFWSYSIGVMIAPIERESGWSRAEISSGPLILAILALFLVPVVGSAIDRVGPRRIALAGVALFCATLACLSFATASIISWWLLWALMSVGAMSILPTLWSAAVTSFFDRSRGLALAVVLCGTGVGGAVVPMLTNFFVERYGWRGAYIGLAIVGFLVAYPVVLILFTSASDDRRKANDSKHAHPVPAPIGAGNSVWSTLGSLQYLKLVSAATFLCLASSAAISNAVPVLVSQGFTSASASRIAGFVGLGAIVGRLCGGYLLDRMDATRVAGVCALAPILTAILLLRFAGSFVASGVAFAALGLSIGTEFDACAYLVARLFGLSNFGARFGVINGLMLFTTGVAPILANHIYDLTGSYNLLLWALIPAFATASFLFFRLGPDPRSPGSAGETSAGLNGSNTAGTNPGI
jgi:MFS family permease